MGKTRVMYLLWGYPQSSQTYIKTELETVRENYDIKILSTHQSEADAPYRNHMPYEHIEDTASLRRAIEEFRPDVLHAHWLHQLETVGELAKLTDTPFTLRSHSFDTLMRDQPKKSRFHLGSRKKESLPWRVRDSVSYANDDLCLGILCFPFSRPLFEQAGVKEAKLFDCFPVLNYQLFYDTSPNGDAIMNAGACLPKKRMDDFIRLAATMPDQEFNLYALGYRVGELDRLNKQLRCPVNIIPAVEPDDMLPEYKKHQWIVYTASKDIGTVGWPITIAEAQAAGVGVCMQNIRPDLKEYVGDAGYLFDSIEEVKPIISKPFAQERRELGFEQARKSDVRGHISLLTDLWDTASPSAV